MGELLPRRGAKGQDERLRERVGVFRCGGEAYYGNAGWWLRHYSFPVDPVAEFGSACLALPDNVHLRWEGEETARHGGGGRRDWPASGFDVNYASNTNAGTATVTVTQAQGAVAYANASMDAAAKKLKVDAKTGKVTVKKGTKVGKYTIKIKVTTAGNVNCKSGSKTVSCKVEVK